MNDTNEERNDESAEDLGSALDLADAIKLVITDARTQDPARRITDREILAEIRSFGHDEIDEWVESEVLDSPSEMEFAFRAVIDASDDEIAAHQPATREYADDDSDCL